VRSEATKAQRPNQPKGAQSFLTAKNPVSAVVFAGYINFCVAIKKA